MANSQKKAEDLKNAYVTGLMDQASADDMAQYAPTGGDMGDTSSIGILLNEGRAVGRNDGDPTIYVMGSDGVKRHGRNSKAAWPNGRNSGYSETPYDMGPVPRSDIADFAEQYYR